jgi:membrane peptidoglycan carboxypeptidase
VVILLGAGVVAGTWFFDSVQLTEPKAEDQVTQLFASDNKTQLATIGNVNRSLVPYQSINPVIKHAVMAAEDKNFYDHHGIDMKGIVRAAWNNFTGGDTQGASTITQQYARHAAELKEISYNRKLREAVIARRMEDHYSKDDILGRYLNSVYFGRGAYGIEAAVKAYFGNSRSALIQPGQKGAITAAEAAVIASVIKQPEPSKTHRGYDPQNNLADAKIRWEYTLNNMVEKKWLPAEQKPVKYPVVQKFNANACRTSCGNDRATGKIVKYVKQELRAMGVSDEDQKKGGLRITTTINPKVQKAAETAASRESKESPLSKLNKEYKSALVAVDPQNGQVLAYYGGSDGVGWDYAGPNYNDSGDFVGGGRPPGSSFKIYTLLAALSDGYGFSSKWDSTKKKVGGDAINNSNRTQLKCDKQACPLDIATVESYNFPFYWLADELGAAKVAEAAHKAGIQYLASPTEIGARVDLSKASEKDLRQFGNEIGYGQYAITALDHANGIATLANDGKFNKAHFVKSVQKRDDKTGKFKPFYNERVTPKQVFDQNVVAAIDHVLQKIPGHNGKRLRDGFDALAKSGTWEFKDGKSKQNGDAWWVGSTRKIAASVWIGREKVKNQKMELQPIFQPGGGKRNMSGGTTPAETWKIFMDLANEAIDAENEAFLPDVPNFGDPEKKGNGVERPDPPQNENCIIPALCPNGGNNGQPGNQTGNPFPLPGNNGQPANPDPNNGQPGNNDGQPGNNEGQPDNGGDDTDQGGGQNNQED